MKKFGLIYYRNSFFFVHEFYCLVAVNFAHYPSCFEGRGFLKVETFSWRFTPYVIHISCMFFLQALLKVTVWRKKCSIGSVKAVEKGVLKKLKIFRKKKWGRIIARVSLFTTKVCPKSPWERLLELKQPKIKNKIK